MEQTSTPGPGSPAPRPEQQLGGSTPGQPPGPGPGQPGQSGRRPRRPYRYRSLFWPVVLIGAGIIWLLYSLDVISVSNLEVLALVWPVFIIGIGVDLIVGHRSPAAGALVGIVTVGIVIVLMMIGPSLDWVGDSEMKTETFSAPVGEATQAQVQIDLSGYAASIHALPVATGPDRPLLYASVTHWGTVEFAAEGTTSKTVTLKSGSGWRSWLHGGLGNETPWDIGLDPTLPLSLTVFGSSGSSSADLSGLRALRSLEVHASSGDSQVKLPVADPANAFRLDLRLFSSSGRMDVQGPDGAALGGRVQMSSGDTRVTLGKDSAADLSFNGSSGQFVLTVRPDQALRVEVKKVSSGDVKLPDGLTRVSGEGEKGVWQTPGYDSAAFRVYLVIESMSSGTVKVEVGG
jgi:LiaI-LiaF-like transmembrane region